MKTYLSRLLSSGLDLMLPPRCSGCGGSGGFLCRPCEDSASSLRPPYCERCASPGVAGRTCRLCASAPLEVDGIRAPYLLEGVVRDAIHDLKYRNLRAAAPSLGRLLARWLESASVPGEVLVPVPLHRRRLRERGYNQSAMLAREVGKATGLPLMEGALLRVRNSVPQVSLSSRQERARNVEGSFQCGERMEGVGIILVDDVVTTGSTMSACAQALKSAGASSVWGIALARQAGGVL